MKKIITSISIFPVILIFSCAKNESDPMNEAKPMHTYLALGDSYTIGHSLPTEENFPNQTIGLLRKSNYDFSPAEIVAQTGWTTDELQNNINNRRFNPPYDFVTLLIGVNNQYRGRPVGDYQTEFESLLKQTIQFTGGRADHVIVLSIPDWGVTPFAWDRDKQQIAKEIDSYNVANKAISETYNINYIDITPWTREAANDPSLVAADGLHPSAKEYRRWAEKIADEINALLR